MAYVNRQKNGCSTHVHGRVRLKLGRDRKPDLMWEMPRKITKIPFPGSSGQVPTGAIQFQDDWPGLFLRGDTAIPLADKIRYLEKALSNHPDKIIGIVLFQLGELATIIENDVRDLYLHNRTVPPSK